MYTLPRSYTVNQMHRGEGMTYHPATGELLAHLSYHSRFYQFGICTPVTFRRLFGLDDDLESQWLLRQRIGGGKKLYLAGESYPSHWKFDPYSGEKIFRMPRKKTRPCRKS